MIQVLSTNAEFGICQIDVVIPGCDRKNPFCMDDCQKKHGPDFIDAVCVGEYKCLCFYSSENSCPPKNVSIWQHQMYF